MDNNTKIVLLTTRKEYIFRDIQILYDLSKEVQHDKTKLGVFKSRYKRIDSVRQEYVEVVGEINELKLIINPKDTIDMKTIEAFDMLYYAFVAVAEALLSSATGDLDSTASELNYHSAAGQKPIAQVRLPKIELPRFDGNIENWQTFYDTFSSLVHENKNINQIEKFHYLLSCLSGSALSIAKGVPVTTDNYQVVFDALQERFQNKRILATNYLDKICSFTPLKSGNLNELRNLTSLLQESVNALKSVKINNLGEFILFYLASRSLDPDTRKRFESQNADEIPTFTDFLTFLQGYVKILEASEPSAPFRVPAQQRANPRFAPDYRYYSDVRNKGNNNYNIKYKTAASTTNVGLCSDAGQYSDLSQHDNTGPHLDSRHYYTGPYSEPGRDSESGPYLMSLPGSYSDTGPYSDPHMYPNSEDHSSAVMYTASSQHSNPAKFPDCTCCGFSHHGIYKCPLFHSYGLIDRQKVAQTKNLCVNCLRPNHSADKCLSKSNCLKCNARHHSLLHDPGKTVAYSVNSNDEHEHPEVPANHVVTMSSTSTSTHFSHSRAVVLLGTCTVRAKGPNGTCKIRALIDSGAQDCFMTNACAQRLGLPLRRCKISVAGLGQNTVHQVKGITTCTIQPCDVDEPRFNICPIVMDTITNKMPAVEIPSTIRDSYRHLTLADESFDKPNEIDLLLGAELFHNIYDGQRLDLGPSLPVALHSVFGWVITGKLDPLCRPPTTTSSLLASTLALDNTVKRFWEVEEPPSLKISNPDDDKCERMYSDLVNRNPDGRYVVPLLLKEPQEELGESYHLSLSRLHNLEKRLLRDEQLKEDYSDFMREYSNLGHMKPIEEADRGLNIIPHHCVLKPDSATTKLRVVFDGSARTTNGNSLNDIVHVGPKLQNDIVDIITKFRLNKIVFTADISKMYRNIDLKPEDRKYQHILWRESPDDPVCEFELNTVTYGVSSSPYLAIRTLHQLANDHGPQWPQAADILRKDTFMDDITAGAPSVEEALKLKNDLVSLLDCGKFELRKWSSNSSEFLFELPEEHCQVPKPFCDETNQHTLKILGIQWDPTQDLFTYSLSEFNSKCTKRTILANIARIYDPLGWVTPVVLIAKILIQNLWRLQLDWDEPVPNDVLLQWHQFLSELKNLKNVRIPRLIIPSDARCFELVGFCDGSTQAYGCCVYLRTVGNDNVAVHLLIAKSRVAPLKPLTVNRLELCGAVLLSRVMKHMIQLLQNEINIVRVTAFTDSSTVLAWLNTPPYKLKTFVAHRVAKINDDISFDNWQHVSTHDNPADHCSRGLSCSQLVSSEVWWSGPKWLAEDSSKWPVQRKHPSPIVIPELKSTVHMSFSTTDPVKPDVVAELLARNSSLSRLQRVLAWCLRFVANVKRDSKARVFSSLTTAELENSLFTLVRHVQAAFFPEEIKSVTSKLPCNHRAVQKLNPFLDESGTLRVGGRLKNATLSLNASNPLLLPKKSWLSRLIIDYYHLLYLHCGPRTLQSLVLRKFWILGIRNLIRSHVAKCVTCFRVKPKPCQPLMGNLPSPRVQPARCFQNVGIDFAGPFTVKESHRRKAPTYKAYVCVIVCLAVKAIHLEAVTDLSTPAFIAALDRFVSRRGLCNMIITDCGRNFIGARRYLSETHEFLLAHQSELDVHLSKRGITWQLNPPTGSHFGGIFEGGVKSMKYHLKRVVGLQVLTFEELTTVLTKIEAVLNSRPLCAISTDPDEVDVLTPGHFLTGGPIVSLPEPRLLDVYLPPRERWQLLQKFTQSFWRVWQHEYLHTLQQRSKWFEGLCNIQLGDIVVIVDQNLPPLEWRFGKVVELHPGTDGVVRVVTIRTSTGLFRRPVTKLCPLPSAH